MTVAPAIRKQLAGPTIGDGRPRLDIVVHALPPQHDAIGEYTSCFAEEAAKSVDVRVLCPLQNAYDLPRTVSTTTTCALPSAPRFQSLLACIINTEADALLLQYNPFGWGRRGWAPDLVRAIAQFRRERPDVRLGVMFHETYMMNPGWRSWVMRQYQRRQFYHLVDLADVSFFSTEKWADEQRKRRPNSEIVHAPVGSNLPDSNESREEARRRLCIQADALVCGVFGGNHPTRMVSWIQTAVEEISKVLTKDNVNVVLLHVGRESLPWRASSSCNIRSAGGLPAQMAANVIASMDLLINPFRDGVSTRRGSIIAALQQSVPVLSTHGQSTDSFWLSGQQRAITLADSTSEADWIDAALRCLHVVREDESAARRDARSIYLERFSWPQVVKPFLACF